MIITILAIIGLALSLYAIRIQRSTTDTPPLCDISENVSCTKAFESTESALFGIKNSYLGVLAYLTAVLLFWMEELFLLKVLVTVMVLVSLYLAYILYFRQRNVCIVCTCVYIVNIALAVAVYTLPLSP